MNVYALINAYFNKAEVEKVVKPSRILKRSFGRSLMAFFVKIWCHQQNIALSNGKTEDELLLCFNVI